jgi:hypothetical protein
MRHAVDFQLAKVVHASKGAFGVRRSLEMSCKCEITVRNEQNTRVNGKLVLTYPLYSGAH